MAGKYAKKPERLEEIFAPRTRVYIYSVVTALGAIAIVYGLVTEEQLGAYLTFAGVLLNVTTGLAIANVPKVNNVPRVDNADN